MYVCMYVHTYVQADRTAAKCLKSACPLKHDVVVFTYVSTWCNGAMVQWCNGGDFESMRDKWSLKPTVTQCVYIRMYVCPSWANTVYVQILYIGRIFCISLWRGLPTYIPMQLHFLCITSSSDNVTPLNSDIWAHILRAQVTVSSNRSRRLVHVGWKRWPVHQTYWLKGVIVQWLSTESVPTLAPLGCQCWKVQGQF